VLIALKNGGAIRDSIAGPSITRLTIASALAFDNPLAVIRVDAAELLAAIENGVSRAPDRDGRFPQVAGIYVEYDADRPGLSDRRRLLEPSRVKTLHVVWPDGTRDRVVENFTFVGDPTREYALVTIEFLATGGDGYAALNAAANARGIKRLEAGERGILAEYIARHLSGRVFVSDPPADARVVRIDAGPK